VSDTQAPPLGGQLDPTLPPEQPDAPPVRPWHVLPNDAVPPPRTLIDDASDWVPEVKPIDLARYTSQAFHEAEVEKMWSRTWQFAVWDGDIPNPGDIHVYRNVGQSVLIVRQQDGSVKAFRNSCLHRGRELCGEATHQPNLRCPYHAFTWGLDGDLQWLPSQWDFPQIDRANFRLPEVRVEQWNGFWFINLDANAPSLASYLGKMVGQWESWDFSSRYRSVTVERKLNCNWKAALDAFIETLHVYASHPEAAFLTPDSATQYDMYPDEPHFSRFHTIVGWASANLAPEPTQQEVLDSYTSVYLPEMFGTPEGDLAEGENAREALRRIAVQVYRDRMGLDVSQIPNSELLDGTEYLIFPHFLVWPSTANPLVYRFRPDGPDNCVWETSLYLSFEGERPAPGPIYRLGVGEPMRDIPELGYVGPILQQDCDNLEFIQAGMKASGTGVAQVARYQEARLRHYHQTIDRYLAG
jgi:phenylpropionate dioxygenase-like ring-hydroxylating dioxygenase large terminal subunit